MHLQSRGQRSPFSSSFLGYIAFFCLIFAHAVGAAKAPKRLESGPSRPGYKYGQNVPISCLSRTIDTGEHLEDQAGKLQYAPFPTCNETSQPLFFRYGISETVSCTITPVSDEIYHLLEYYVHSDVPLTCRMPTSPLGTQPTEPNDDPGTGTGESSDGQDLDAASSSPFTPITLALQGTLQRSHLHIWSEMNVLLHQSPLSSSSKRRSIASRQVVAGTAYSVPMIAASGTDGKDADTVNIPWDPWAAGQGTKVVRGEALTMTFRVGWVPDGDVLGLVKSAATSKSASGGVSGFFSRLFVLVMAAAAGGVIALWWDRTKGKRNPRWRGEGLLGNNAPSSGSSPLFGKNTGGTVTFGDRGRINGYGGYIGNGSNGNGYGGYSTGKKD